MITLTPGESRILLNTISKHAAALGFSGPGVSHRVPAEHQTHFVRWLRTRQYGDMHYLARNVKKRLRPASLFPGALSVLCFRMHYATDAMDSAWATLNNGKKAYISRYALGRDYHKVFRQRLWRLAQRIQETLDDMCGVTSADSDYRAFVDSAPTLEKALAISAGIGWMGKHTNIISTSDGSWYFLGELFTNLLLPANEQPVADHCGRCRRCIDVCPTQAIIAPYKLDALRCISYLTIEHKGIIPVELRRSIGNRIFGCDDCQLVCPWNRFAQKTSIADFAPRHNLDNADLLTLFSWDEATFRHRTEGMALRRISYAQWQRNLAIALGNAPPSMVIINALRARRDHCDPLVQPHIDWALHAQAHIVC